MPNFNKWDQENSSINLDLVFIDNLPLLGGVGESMGLHAWLFLSIRVEAT